MPRAALYGLAAVFMVGGLVLAGAPPGVRWGMFLIGYALFAAARNIPVPVRAREGLRGTVVRLHARPTRDVGGRSGPAVQRGDRLAGDALQRAGGQPVVQRAVGAAEQP